MTVAIPLAELRYGEEFTTLTGAAGVVRDTGYVLWDDDTGRQMRVRAVLVALRGREVILRAELRVFVPEDRPHLRLDHGDARWGKALREPGGVGDRAMSRRAPGPRRQQP